MDITKLNEQELYEYLKSLDEDRQMEVIEEINSNLHKYTKDDLSFLQSFNAALERVNEDLMYRDKFYFELYNLIDKDGNLTPLGEYYEYIFTHHYIKAIKKYMKFSKGLRERNEVFKKNDKALEYLEYFKNHITSEVPSQIIKKNR